MRHHAFKSRELAVPAPLIELLALGLLSLTAVTALTSSLAGRPTVFFDLIPVDRLTGFALGSAVVMLIAGVALQFVRATRRETVRLATETSRLQARLAAAEGIIRAEPQVLIYWEPGESLRVVCHGLTSVPGLPESQRDLLRFGQWLTPDAAVDLKTGLDDLFATGRSFNMILKTVAGGHVEAEGRTAGGRAVLRLVDVVGYKRDLARILDQHHDLKSEIAACRALIDNLPSPVWFRSPEGRLKWVNRAYCTAVEASGSAEVSDRQIELLETRQRQAVDRMVQRRETFRERTDVLLGGERKAHDLLVLPVGQGQVAVALDVTAVERAQGELDRRNAAFERTLDKVSTAIAIFAPDRRLTYCNEAYIALFGLDLTWLASGPNETTVLDRLRETGRLPETNNYRDWRVKFLARMRSSASAEELWHLADGRTLKVMAENRDDGGITYLYTDETETLALERLYHQQITTQRETLDSLSEGVAVFGTDGRLRYNNRAFAAIWELPETICETKPHMTDVIGRVQHLYDDQSTWARLKGAVGGLAESREPAFGTMVRRDQRLIAYGTLPLADGGTLLTFTDNTDAKRYERLLEERNEALVADERLKNRFIGHVSYELRTPLTNIIGFTDMLSSPLIGGLNPKQREYLAHITSSSKALQALVDNILDLATIDAGAMELKLEPVSVARVIDDAIEGVRDRAIQAKLTIDIGLAEDATTFVADEARVRQVLFNLIANAIGFSRTGDTVLISAWRADGAMHFSVKDDGVGIPPDQLPRLFDRFESHARGSTHRGAGLGLSIVKSLVDLHGGTVHVESQLGQGTMALVSFPLDPSARLRPSEITRPGETAGSDGPQAIRVAGRRRGDGSAARALRHEEVAPVTEPHPKAAEIEAAPRVAPAVAPATGTLPEVFIPGLKAQETKV